MGEKKQINGNKLVLTKVKKKLSKDKKGKVYNKINQWTLVVKRIFNKFAFENWVFLHFISCNKRF